ncbi:MAG: tripartite tricarboxylate transporter permease [Desulfobacterales bacterium]|nr:tripartite tricarboxylate transporter permease [Desulfobacterales bacterium]
MAEVFNCLIAGMVQLFNQAALALMLMGIFIGFIVGILPGLGGPTALALMLPFIIKMNAVEAFAFLLGMAAVTTTTGEITSILFGVPGEPTTAATILDGHPMAKRGEAGRALGAALMSSLLGAIFGAFALGLAIPVVRPLVLSFGSPEFFMVAILGITFVSSLSGEARLRGLIAGGAGLILATIGMDPMSGIQRFTFGQLFLWDGIGLVPITVGFFAIPEIIDLAVEGSSIAGKHTIKLGGIMQGVTDTFRHWWLVIRCSAIGTFVGVMPGIGGATSQWLAYAHAVQSSGEKGRFGKGAIEGVIGPSAADNSTLGGSLVPTIAFGVPGSVMMAILLGAFLIQGLVPGPDMLIPEAQGGHLALTFSFMWTIVVANIVTVVICFLFLKQLVKITQIRGNLLIPVILVLIYLGAFAENNVFVDMPLVILFGTLGWAMQKVDWPRPPLILGLVLGPLAENRLFLSTDNYGYAWLGRPIVLVLILMTLAGALYPVLRAYMEKMKLPLPAFRKKAGLKKGIHLNRNVAFALFAVILFTAALWQSRNFTVRAGLFPWVIGIPVLFMALTELVLSFTGLSSVKTLEGGEKLHLPAALVKERTAGIFYWIIGFFLAIWFLGFAVGGPLATFCHLKFEGKEKWLITLVLTGAIGTFIYVFFYRILNVPFPQGLVPAWLGISP